MFFLKPETRRLILYYTFITMLAVLFLGAFFLSCPTHDIAGVTDFYPNR